MGSAKTVCLFLILVLFLFGLPAYAEFPRITMLTDQKFDPISQSDVMLGGVLIQYPLKRGDISVATLTMEFSSGEIGQDDDAAHILAMKAAAKIGADLLLYVSGTVIKDTKAIASMTYRCIRTAEYSRKQELLKERKRIEVEMERKRIEIEKERKFIEQLRIPIPEGYINPTEEKQTRMRKLLGETEFGAKYLEFLDTGGRWDYSMILMRIGVSENTTTLDSGKTSSRYVDSNTNKPISHLTYSQRLENYYVNTWLEFFKSNIGSYKSAYEAVQRIKAEYADVLGTNMPFPTIELTGPVNFDRMRAELNQILVPGSQSK